MGDGVSLARRSSLRPADVAEHQRLGEDLPQPRGHVGPGAHVPRLLLDPHHLSQLWVLRDQREDLGLGERIQELDPPYRNLRALRAPLVPDELVVELAAAQEQARYLFGVDARL